MNNQKISYNKRPYKVYDLYRKNYRKGKPVTETSLYVGNTGNIEKRMRQHEKPAKHGKLYYKMKTSDVHCRIISSHKTATAALKKEREVKQLKKPIRNKSTYKKPKNRF